jgi:hypothetical protein
VRLGFESAPATIFDISMGGASVKTPLNLRALDEVMVVFNSFPGKPEFHAKVRHSNSLTQRIGIEFLGDQARSRAEILVRAAIEQGNSRVTDPSEHEFGNE